MEWTGGKWRSFAQHYFVEPFFMFSQLSMGLVVYLVPGWFFYFPSKEFKTLESDLLDLWFGRVHVAIKTLLSIVLNTQALSIGRLVGKK